MADRVGAYLTDLGLAWDEDASGPAVGSDSGNLFCRLPGREAAGVPVFFCAHLDTVPPEGPIEPVVADGIVRNRAGTILGADNKATVAAMLVAAATILRENRPHVVAIQKSTVIGWCDISPARRPHSDNRTRPTGFTGLAAALFRLQ